MSVLPNPVACGRIVSAGSGLVTAAGLFAASALAFRDIRYGWWTVILFIIYPLALVLNRMALYESPAGALYIWCLFLAMALAKTARREIAYGYGLIAGAGILNRASGFFAIYLLLPSLVILGLRNSVGLRRVFSWVIWTAIVSGIAGLCYLVLLLSPSFPMISVKNREFVYSIGELFRVPVAVRMVNTVRLTDWMVTYLTWPAILAIFSAFRISGFFRGKAVFLLWSLVPLSVLAFAGRTLYPRYIYFLSLPLLPLIAYSAGTAAAGLRRKSALILLMLLMIMPALYTDLKILIDMPHAPIPQEDRYQYVNGWPAGGGIREIMAFIRHESETEKICVITEGTYGSLPTTAVELYYFQNPNVIHKAVRQITPDIPDDIISLAADMPLYLIVNRSQEDPAWPVELVARYRKGSGTDFIRLYRVRPERYRHLTHSQIPFDSGGISLYI
ncbi:hypothetical protein A2Z33_06535 [Candidatus Gottesmanbacteria bacterium RBG_16_52_11]|uniref:Glycosyltransferase RgtA/B/C/D-like domain-containing protein n=1 Tax=Candidatus Gottesmanbacteria bacterium RBG_16_52_11 TaxID=1798374 RepID=A0A1F5YXR1_9BACT|nr:MAG: hypothetical protein A2Z33_06535 [Candidatus Gottesmanbacteria bacterium RBG_16_52_11]